MKWVADGTGRFPRRPFYRPEELDNECERIVIGFLRERSGAVDFPISTDDLSVMIERDTSELDLYADLSKEGEDIEGLTDFYKHKKPSVRIAKELSDDILQAHRLRTTLAHEYGHVKFHYFLWDINFKAEPPGDFWKILSRQRRKIDAFRKQTRTDNAAAGEGNPVEMLSGPQCRHALMVDAPAEDWMEWQAGYAGGALLMPVSAVKKFVDAAGVKNGKDFVSSAAKMFDVSPDAAASRLHNLGFLADSPPEDPRPVKNSVNYSN